MPVVAVAVRGLLAGLVYDALRVIIPLIVGLYALTLAMGQGIAAESLRTPSTRAEFFRPLLVTVSRCLASTRKALAHLLWLGRRLPNSRWQRWRDGAASPRSQ